MAAVLSLSPPELELDEAAFVAFEITPTDKQAIEAIADHLSTAGRPDLAGRFGERLVHLDPTHARARRWIDEAKTIVPPDKITKPISEGMRMPFGQ